MAIDDRMSNAKPSGLIPKTLGESLFGGALIVFLLNKFLEESFKALPAGALRIAILLGVLVFAVVVVPALRRARKTPSADIQQILNRREVRKNPFKVSTLAALFLLVTELVVSGVVTFLFGLALPQVVQDPIMWQSGLFVITVLTLAALLIAAVWLGRWVTHRIAGREVWWVLGATLLYRLVALPPNLLAAELAKVKIEPLPWLAVTGALLVAAWMGHRWGARTQNRFTLSYLFAQLPPEDQVQLVDLAASVASSSGKSDSGTGPQ